MIQENSKDSVVKNKSKKTVIKKVVTKKTNKDNKIKAYKFKDLEGKFLHVKVGTQGEPATDLQIKDVEKQIVSLFEKNNINCITFVTHHAVSMDIIEKQGE